MGQRFTVQADTERECAAGLQLLLSLGLELTMPPRLLSDSRWMARAAPSRIVEVSAGSRNEETST